LLDSSALRDSALRAVGMTDQGRGAALAIALAVCRTERQGRFNLSGGWPGCYNSCIWFADSIAARDFLNRTAVFSLAIPAWWVTTFGPFLRDPETIARAANFISRDGSMSKKLYVGNLNYQVTNANLEEMFAEHGVVRSAEVIMDRDKGTSKGFGFVEMADDQAASKAIGALNDRDIDGRHLVVNEARPRTERWERPAGRGSYGGRR
jgi:cold-inducible RNA-binding protein